MRDGIEHRVDGSAGRGRILCDPARYSAHFAVWCTVDALSLVWLCRRPPERPLTGIERYRSVKLAVNRSSE
jgi:hypothetical protein